MDYLALLRRRWRLVALTTVLAVAAATILSLRNETTPSKPTYSATATALVSSTNPRTSDSVLGAGDGQFAPLSVLIRTRRVLAPVARKLGLTMPTDALAAQLTAMNPPGTRLLDVIATDTEPRQAERLADATVSQLIQVARQVQAKFSGNQAKVQISLLRRASAAPVEPDSPTRNVRDFVFALIVGVALGMGAAIIREILDTRIRGLETLRQEFGLTPLAEIRLSNREARGPTVFESFDAAITEQSQRSPADAHSQGQSSAEEFRQLRTNLRAFTLKEGMGSVLVTSAVAGEGKTVTACNLAVALALDDVDAVLVDGDLRHTNVATHLNLAATLGLTDVLAGGAKLDDVLIRYQNLAVLPSGSAPPNPSELLGTKRMGHLATELTKRYGVVVVDSPPLLPFTDAAVLAATCTNTLLIVRSEHTRRDDLARALLMLENVGVRAPGAVLMTVPGKGASPKWPRKPRGRIEPTPDTSAFASAEGRPLVRTHQGAHPEQFLG